MRLTTEDFKYIASHIALCSENTLSGFVDLDYYYHQNVVHNTVSFQSLAFKDLDQLHKFCKYSPVPLRSVSLRADPQDIIAHINVVGFDYHAMTLQAISNDTISKFKTIKLKPTSVDMKFVPSVIAEAPYEYMQGDHTYRILTGRSHEGHASIMACAREDEPIYDYLDKGYFLGRLSRREYGPSKLKYPASDYSHDVLVSDEFSINVAHVYMMCLIRPKLAEMLKHGFFISASDAELLKLKMLKKLDDNEKTIYKSLADKLDEDYKSNTTLIVVSKMMKDELSKTTLNNIEFTKNTAKYEHVEIEYEGLLGFLYQKLNFNSEFDIYTIARLFANEMERELDISPAERTLPTLKINGIDIVARITETKQRYVNNIRINKDEINQVIHRATCYHDKREYELFLQSISRMSLKWHDILANGLPVKLNAQTWDAFNNPEPGPDAPVLRFTVKDKQIHLKVSDDRLVKVQFSRLIDKVKTLNKKTDNRWGRRYNPALGYVGHRRNNLWCAEMLTEVLLECSTYETKTKNQDGTESVKKETLLTKEDIIALLKVVDEEKRKALEKSKEFMAAAVKLSKAEQIEFLGKPAYKVQGSLRTYAVIIETAKVYDYDTKQYRCIVNDRHYAGVGYDDIAARLLALRNDRMMQTEITTLQGGAQPRYENAHNDYNPERDHNNRIEEIVERKLASV